MIGPAKNIWLKYRLGTALSNINLPTVEAVSKVHVASFESQLGPRGQRSQSTLGGAADVWVDVWQFGLKGGTVHHMIFWKFPTKPPLTNQVEMSSFWK